MIPQLFINIIRLFLVIFLSTSVLQAYGNDSTRIGHTNERSIFEMIQAKNVPSVIIKTSIDSIVSNKKTNNKYPATFIFTASNGTVFEKSIELKPRGRSRRKYCDFPPLQINFSKKELKSKGIKTDHKKLKLVTHCIDGLTSTPNILKEYLVYKIYNELNPNSLKAQLLKTQYQDINTNKVLEKYSILLEDIDELAERLNGQEVEGYAKPLEDFSEENLNLFTLFQYMIGNEDWDFRVQRNIKFIKIDNVSKLIAIPYDFDSAGLVATAYAQPNRNYDLQSVKQRYFMGKFVNKRIRNNTIALFKKKKETIYQMVDDLTAMDELTKLEVKEYLDGFYKIIETPVLMKRAFPVNGKQPEISDMEGEMHF